LCGLKFGKLLLYDIERQEVVAQNNRAHVKNCLSEHPISFCDTFDINSVSCTNDPSIFASAADDGLVKLWDKRMFTYNCKPIGGFIGHHQGIVSLDFRTS
jgi:WD40 repeat protein